MTQSGLEVWKLNKDFFNFQSDQTETITETELYSIKIYENI